MKILEVIGETLGTVIILLLLTFLYFLPAIIADKRKHDNANKVYWINLIVGWTFIGWIICLVWVLRRKK